MPKELDECVSAVQRDEGYSESRAYAICVAAYKKKHGKNPKMKEIDEMTLCKEFSFYVPVEVTKSKEGEVSMFGGIASSCAVDRDNDRIETKALGKMAQDLLRNPTVFFNHDHKGLAVGKVVSSEVRGGDKLYIDVQPSKAAGVKDVVTQINEGILRGLSIGGKVKEAETVYDKSLGKDVRIVKDVELYEVSVVGIPANADASIMSSITKAWGDSVVDVSKKEVEKAETHIKDEDVKKELIEPSTGGGPSSKQAGPGTKEVNDKATVKSENKGGQAVGNKDGQPEADEGAKHIKEAHPDLSSICPQCGFDLGKKASKSVTDEDLKKVLEHPGLKKVVSAFVNEDLKKAFEENVLELKAVNERLADMQKKAYGPKRRGEVDKSGNFKDEEVDDDKKTNVEFPSLLRASKGI